MKIAPSSAAANASARKRPAPRASEVPTRTGATAAGSVRTRAAMIQIRTALARGWTATMSGPLGKAREVGPALLDVGIAALVRLRALVEEQVGVVRELLDAGQSV